VSNKYANKRVNIYIRVALLKMVEKERYQECRESALRHMTLADHMFTMTYPLVQDPKLLKVVVKNLYTSMEQSLAALLNYERYYKRVPPFTENLGAMLDLARPVFEKYKISHGYIGFINELKEVLDLQKDSDVEFVRKEKVVFASKDYDLNSISVKEIKDYIAKAKLFMHEVMGVVIEK
jgi:hypothetical protein